jgi:hypothetical protein
VVLPRGHLGHRLLHDAAAGHANVSPCCEAATQAERAQTLTYVQRAIEQAQDRGRTHDLSVLLALEAMLTCATSSGDIDVKESE